MELAGANAEPSPNVITTHVNEETITDSVSFIETPLLASESKRVFRNWWIYQGSQCGMGCSTIVLGSVLIGVNYEENLIPLALHAFCIGAFIADGLQ